MTASVGIAIPTLNRSDFVIRQLQYYAAARGRVAVYIGDSSDADHGDRIAEEVRQIGSRVKIVHVRSPGVSAIETLRRLVYAVEEPYSVYVGDDDFLVPQSLELCTEFLDAHPNYATAHGKAVLTCTSAHGRVEFASRYAQRSVPHERASARLTDLLGEYFVLQFSVQRTAWFREDLDVVATVADLSFTELLSSSLSIVRGPAWEVDRMSLVRVHHENRQSLPDMYDWITDSKWLPAYEVFSKCLAERIVAQDGVAPEAASETVKEAFWAYLAKGLKTKWAGRYAPVSISSRFKEIGRQVPGLVGAWERVRSTIPGDKRFSLPALLRRSSPYHDDFLPICRAIEASGDGR